MRNLLLFTLLWLLSAQTATAKTHEGPPPGQLTVSISGGGKARICGTSSVSMTFTNAGPVPVTLGQINANLNNFQSGLITLLDIVNSPFFTVLSGTGTSTPTFSYGKPLQANETVVLTMEVQYSCNFFSMIGNLSGYQFSATGSWQTIEPEPFYETYSVQSPPYEIKYSYITPGLNLPPIQTPYNTPFEIIVPLEVSGTYCDDDFMVSLREHVLCYDYSQLSYSLILGDVAYGPFSVPPQTGSGVFFEVKASQVGIPSFCSANYPGGVGELKLVLHNIIAPCGCGVPGTFYKTYIGFTPCSNADAPTDCKSGANVSSQESILQEIKFLTPVAGTLKVEKLGNNTFGFCASQNSMSIQVSNNSSNPVYHVGLDFTNSLGYQITQVEMANGQVFTFTPPASSASLSFDNNTLFNIGLQDLNGDGIFAEMAPGTSFTAQVSYSAPAPHCSVGNSDPCSNPCQTVNISGDVIKTTAHWNNVCNTITPVPSSALGYSMTVKPGITHIKYEGNKLGYNSPRKVTIETNEGKLEILPDYLQQNSTLRRYICIKANVNCIKFDNVRINGVPFAAVFNNGYADLGPVDPQNLGNTVIDFDFQISCCPLDLSEITLNISQGVFFENCPCFITMGCGEANFISPCSGDGGCTLFSLLETSTYNEVYAPYKGAPPVPTKVYPCDCLMMKVKATVANSIPGGRILLGVRISDDFASYFKTPYTFAGSFTVTMPGGINVSVIFSNGTLVDVPNEPYSFIYFESSATSLFSAGNVISGSFTMCMASSFPGDFIKMDYFEPALGVRIGQDRIFCHTGQSNLYAMDVHFQLDEPLTASCALGGTYTAKLTKIGGELFGPDFPGIPRPAARIINNVEFSIANGDQAFQVLPSWGHGCTHLGNPYVFSAANITQPTGYEKHGDVLQTFSVRFEENCEGTVPVKAVFDIAVRPGANSPCSSVEHHVGEQSASGGSFPNIAATFGGNLGNSETMLNNTYTLSINTSNTGADATSAWVQLEFDPTRIAINLAGITGPMAGQAQIINGACGKSVLVIPIGALANPDGSVLTHSIPMQFLLGSCSGLTDVKLYGFHRCGCETFPGYNCAANYSDPSICKDTEKNLTLEMASSGLVMTKQLCSTGTGCNKFKVFLKINNPGIGNTNDVTFQTTLPPGVMLTAARYGKGIPNGNCPTVYPSDPAIIAALQAGGWVITDNTLKGVYGNDLDRNGYLVLEFALNGVSPLNDDVIISCHGISPCGLMLHQSATIQDVSQYQVVVQPGTLVFPPNLCDGTPGPTTSVLATIYVSSPIYFPILNYSNVIFVCDGNDNGIADPTDAILFQGNLGIFNEVPGNPNHAYTKTFSIPTSSLLSCIGHPVIMTLGTLYFGELYNPCAGPAVGYVCGGKPYPRSIISDQDGDSSAASWKSSIQPNPFSDQLTVRILANNAEKADIMVFDQLGATVYSRSHPIEKGRETDILLNLSDLTSGVYHLRVMAGGKPQHHVVVKQ